MRHTIAVLLALTLVATAPVGGRQTTDVQTRRLATLGRVWLAVKFAHPRVALTSRDWDAVLTGAVSAVKSATDDRSFDAAIEGMLRTLDDPVTRVISSAEPPAPMAGGPARPAFSSLPAGALLIDLRAPAVLNDAAAVREAIAANLAAITKADRMIVDIRGARQNPFMAERTFDAFNELLISTPTALPAARVVRHAGYRAQAGGASFYGSEVATESAVLVKPREGMTPRRVAFIVDRLAMVPPIALALRAAGAGAIVAVGESPATPVRSMTVPVGAKSMATIRVSDLALAGRRTELDVDAALAGSESDQRVYARAAELIAAARPAVPGIEDPFPLWQPEPAYDTTPFPSEPLRLLAVYRLWGILDNFNPYKELADRRWDEALTTFIPRVLAARDELEYARAIAAMAALTQDSHVRVSGSRALTKYLGEVGPPVYVRYIEGRPVVTRVVDEVAAPGLAPGDEIVSVDGEDVAARARRIEECITFSTTASRNGVVAARLLAGDPGTAARIAIRGADGRTREVEVKRPSKPSPAPQRTGDVFKILEGNIGYADLERLENPQVASMFDQLKGTSGIIFDMRGYPRGTAWSIAPRINTKKATAAALFYRPLLTAGSGGERLSFIQDLPPTTTWVYERPTVMLIDERAISQSEHSGLFYKGANGTTFVGSATTGANGDVTSMLLPGGIRVSFTGHDVRWPDGRQLQRVGLIPDVPVTPTIAGIRAGRDEVLEAAVAFLKKQGGKTSP